MHFTLRLHEEHDGVAGDAAVLAERVHLFVSLGLDVDDGLVAAEHLAKVRLDGGLVGADLGPLRDNGAVEVANLVPLLAVVVQVDI